MPAAGVVCCLVTIAGSLVMGVTTDELHPGVHMLHSSTESKVEAPSVFKICFDLYNHNNHILGFKSSKKPVYTSFSVFRFISCAWVSMQNFQILCRSWALMDDTGPFFFLHMYRHKSGTVWMDISGLCWWCKLHHTDFCKLPRKGSSILA